MEKIIYSKKRGNETEDLETSAKHFKLEPERDFSLTEVDFIPLNPSSMIEQVSCSICSSVTIEPHMLNHCQHTFCKNCILAYCKSDPKRVEHTCPICRALFLMDNITKNLLQSNIIDKLVVVCLHEQCSWKGEYGNIYSHIKNDCKHLFICECEKFIDRSQIDQHSNTCQCIKIKCICGRKIEKGKLKQHELEKCPSAFISCEYEMHGCSWKGQRNEYWDDHESECKVRRLCKELYLLKKGIGSEGDMVTKAYKKSDCFIISGLSGENTPRRQLLLKYIKSTFNLEFPIKIGSTSENIICMTSLEISGIFDFDTKKVANNCMLDIDLKEGVMAITFSGKKDRFFIIPIKDGKPTIKRLRGGRINITFDTPKNKLTCSPIVYSHREWLNYQDAEYPFTLEPSSRFISKFNLHHEGGKVENDSLHAILAEFFTLDAWNNSE